MVEDNAGDRWYFSELLRSRGYTVVSCESGEVAEAAFTEEPTPLVLLDLMLPGMDGLELCRRIRAHPEGSHPVILAVTGQEEPDVITAILDAGADDFVRKPVDPHLLDIRLRIAERRLAEQGERRRTAAALANTTRELATLFQNLHDVFFSVDLTEDRLIQVSPASERLFGHAPEELLADPSLWRRFLLPADRDDHPWDDLREASVAGPVNREYAVHRADGDLRWIRVTVQVEQDAEGVAVRADGMASDITEERRARMELARRNEELDALHRLAEVSLSASGLDEAYEQILAQVSAILGTPIVAIAELDRDRSRLVLTATRGLPEPADDQPREIPLHGSFSGTAVQSHRPVIVTDPTRLRRQLPAFLSDQSLGFWAAFPLMAGPEPLGTLLLGSPEPVPWSDRRTALAGNLATSVAAYAERLEAEEALRLSEARYRKLAEELQQANDELESFAYSVSHDLRAPLRTMQGFAHALLQNFGDSLPPEARDYARRIIASGAQSENLISDLLAYSRLSFEQMELKPVDLGAVVEAAQSQVQAYLDEARAHVEVERPLPTVLGNHTTLVQVVANLLSNAVKFVPSDRKPEVRIRSEDRGEEVRLWVEDNGVGIPVGQEERIFRVFERLAESGNEPGTGIGLAIVRRGIQRIGGTCGVERRADQGSAFWVQLLREEKRSWRPWARRG